MSPPPLLEALLEQGAVFASPAPPGFSLHYGDAGKEFGFLADSAGLLDFSPRGRLCLTGADRVRFLNGQVTNQVGTLQPGQGCHAALVGPKAKMDSDLNIHLLENEILLDFEAGLTARVAARIEKYVIAEDVQVVDAAQFYGLLSLQGPKAGAALSLMGLAGRPPKANHEIARFDSEDFGEAYVARVDRLGAPGFDLYLPADRMPDGWRRLAELTKRLGGGPVGWAAFEVARIEAGVPRFGQDMDATIMPPEAGLAARAMSYNKGCYIGQEIIARIRTYGQVAKSLKRLAITADDPAGAVGAKLRREGKEVGWVTSSCRSPKTCGGVGLGYIRRGSSDHGTVLELSTGGTAVVAGPPFGA